MLHGFVNARVQAHGQAIAQSVDALHQAWQIVALVTQHMQHRAKDFALKQLEVGQLYQRGRHKMALCRDLCAQRRLMDVQALGLEPGDVLFNAGLGVGVDHGADVSGQLGGVAAAQLLHGAVQHGQQPIGAIALHAQQAQGRAALACAVKGRGDNVLYGLLDQGGRIHNHGVLAAGLGHQHHGLAVRAQSGGSLLVQQSGHFGGAGEQYTGHAGVGHQRGAHGFATAWQQLQHFGRDACLVQQVYGLLGNQRCLLGRLGKDGIAGGQSSGDLAGEDGQREVPGADADQGAYAWGKQACTGLQAQLCSVVAQKVDGLAHLGDRVGSRLAGLAHQLGHQWQHMGLIVVGRCLQQAGAQLGRAGTPCGLGLHCGLQGQPDLQGRGIKDMAQQLLVPGRIGDGAARGLQSPDGVRAFGNMGWSGLLQRL